MREIKFRAWFKDTQEMKSVAMNNLYMGNKSSWMHLSPQPMSDYRLVEIMQYTGLKDKNGRKIYEGDILDYKWKASTRDLLIVEWSEKDACFLMGGVRTDYAIAYGEVIGNIYDNPELLEVD